MAHWLRGVVFVSTLSPHLPPTDDGAEDDPWLAVFVFVFVDGAGFAFAASAAAAGWQCAQIYTQKPFPSQVWQI